MIKDIPSHVASTSPYGVKDMVGNGYEMTLRHEQQVFKGSEVDYDFKEKLKAKTELHQNNLTEQAFKTPIFGDNEKPLKTKIAFRCVKPIFSLQDLEEVQKDG